MDFLINLLLWLLYSAFLFSQLGCVNVLWDNVKGNIVLTYCLIYFPSHTTFTNPTKHLHHCNSNLPCFVCLFQYQWKERKKQKKNEVFRKIDWIPCDKKWNIHFFFFWFSLQPSQEQINKIKNTEKVLNEIVDKLK